MGVWLPTVSSPNCDPGTFVEHAESHSPRMVPRAHVQLPH